MNTHAYQIIRQTFLFCLKRNVPQHKPLKVGGAKKSFPSVYNINSTYFDEYFLFHLITGRPYFLYKFIVTQRIGATTMLLRSLKKMF